ncbi:VOC family protein [Actinoplanes sp. NPDC051851]|uniref:VOC family protein n=1 Tax=Actinoplanes sp. NPDC051851 TaxID=3154753 RepID=UPI00344702AF
MPVRWEQLVVDADDPARLARWWAEALGYVIVRETPGEVEIRRSADELPGLLFTPVADAKKTKNRLHIDLRPEDQESEVERLVNMGARPADIGQGDPAWVVLADPEGNEFCILDSKPPIKRSS